jgi:hypothetical protein
MHGARLALAVAMVALLTSSNNAAAAATYAQESLDRYFRFEYDVTPSATRPVVSGYVYNMNPGVPVERMQVSVDGLDSSGNVIGTTSSWVLGGVPPGNRAYFSVRAVPAASYRVQVLFFDWGSRGGSGT